MLVIWFVTRDNKGASVDIKVRKVEKRIINQYLSYLRKSKIMIGMSIQKIFITVKLHLILVSFCVCMKRKKFFICISCCFLFTLCLFVGLAKVFCTCFVFNYPRRVWLVSDLFPRTHWERFKQIFFLTLLFLMYVAHDKPLTLAYSQNKHSQHPQKDQKHPETRKQVGRWRKIQESKKWEVELTSNKVWGRRKEKLFKRIYDKPLPNKPSRKLKLFKK